MFSSLAARNRQPELMDRPDLEPDRFIGSLVGLRRVNRLTQSTRILWPELRQAAQRQPGRRIRVLDVACGGGDVIVNLWKRARRARLPVELHGCDINPLAVQHAQEFARLSCTDVTFFQFDAVGNELPGGYDVVMCSLFLHHLPKARAVDFLRRAAEKTQDRLLVHDLTRSVPGYVLAKYGIRFLLCNDVCRIDGLRSVQGAFTCAEAEALMRAAGLEDGQVKRKFPSRFLLRWVRP